MLRMDSGQAPPKYTNLMLERLELRGQRAFIFSGEFPLSGKNTPVSITISTTGQAVTFKTHEAIPPGPQERLLLLDALRAELKERLPPSPSLFAKDPLREAYRKEALATVQTALSDIIRETRPLGGLMGRQEPI